MMNLWRNELNQFADHWAAAALEETMQAAESTAFDSVGHRTAFDARFPMVDDIVDRLSSNTQIAARAVIKTD